MTDCPCGSQHTYQSCCQPYLSGQALPPTPETLMRSRYTAYTRANIRYIQQTQQDPSHRGFDAKTAKAWAKKATWLKLTVVNAPPPAPLSQNGTVEFVAEYLYEGRKEKLHEVSHFEKTNDHWFYILK